MTDVVIMKKKPSSIDEMNLKSIQRLDPCAISIIDKSTHAALYRFNKSKAAWVKTSVEGPLFLYKRIDSPLYSLMIANRQSLEDHIEPIVFSLRFFLASPYIFMNNEEGEIRGFWFFEEDDCTRLYDLLLKLVSATVRPHSAAASISNNQTVSAIENGYGTDAFVERENCCERKDMPALLQQLFCGDAVTKLPDVPTTGAMSADQIEKQFLCKHAENETDVAEVVTPAATKLLRKRTSSLKTDIGSLTLPNLLNDLTLDVPDQATYSKNTENLLQPLSKRKIHNEASRDDSVSTTLLSKEQLLVALKHLLKDDNFVTHLHRAYLDSINKRLGLKD